MPSADLGPRRFLELRQKIDRIREENEALKTRSYTLISECRETIRRADACLATYRIVAAQIFGSHSSPAG